MSVPRPGGCRRLLIRLLLAGAIVVVVIAITAGGLWWYFHPNCERTNGVVYGQRHDHDLTFDLVRPTKPNGAGVILMVSGRWKSRPSSFDLWMVAPMIRRGYTIFAVSHRSQPEVSVQETVADLHRAVRFVRHHAAEYGVDPKRLGVTGGSSGGHLCLMLATRGGPGPADAPDPIDRESSSVQAAAVFFPVTNLFDLGTSTENAGDGGPPKSFREAFGAEGKDPAKWQVLAKELSPVFLAYPGQAPVYIVHGSADTLTPLEQSEWFRDASAKAGAKDLTLEVREGKGHGWLTMVFDIVRFADWFDAHLTSPRGKAR
jgi:acetyl esterase/lipase